MVLTAAEEKLVSVVRLLPEAEAQRLILWAEQLHELSGGKAVDWSDAWSDNDLAEASGTSAAAIDEIGQWKD